MSRGPAILAALALLGGAVLSSVALAPRGPTPSLPAITGLPPVPETTPAPAEEARPDLRGTAGARGAPGLRCPDGSCLPLLNGVPAAPPLTRAPHLGPLPPVVGLVVDTAGDDWYVHADGSATTTRFRRELVGGVERWNVETVHNARLPDAAGVPRREGDRSGPRAAGAESVDVRSSPSRRPGAPR